MINDRLKAGVPWWIKICMKVALHRLRLDYQLWKRLNIFRQGYMDNPQRARDIFYYHYNAVQRYADLSNGWSGLELGPGDSVLAGVYAKHQGASITWHVDVAPYASFQPGAYNRALGGDTTIHRTLFGPTSEDVRSQLEALGIRYRTNGLQSLAEVPSDSVDIVWSNAVLEHIRKDEFDAVMRETFRVLRPGGVASHWIDFQDHLANSLHSLRFSEALWEAEWFAKSGFYTNRLRRCDVRDICLVTGFEVVEEDVTKWPKLPLHRHSLNQAFQGYDEEELLIKDMLLVVRKPT